MGLLGARKPRVLNFYGKIWVWSVIAVSEDWGYSCCTATQLHSCTAELLLLLLWVVDLVLDGSGDVVRHELADIAFVDNDVAHERGADKG